MSAVGLVWVLCTEVKSGGDPVEGQTLLPRSDLRRTLFPENQLTTAWGCTGTLEAGAPHRLDLSWPWSLFLTALGYLFHCSLPFRDCWFYALMLRVGWPTHPPRQTQCRRPWAGFLGVLGLSGSLPKQNSILGCLQPPSSVLSANRHTIPLHIAHG